MVVYKHKLSITGKLISFFKSLIKKKKTTINNNN